MSNIKTFFLNGEQYETERLLKVKTLLNYFNYNPTLFILEYNKVIINKIEWPNIIIQSNAKIELISIVGGG